MKWPSRARAAARLMSEALPMALEAGAETQRETVRLTVWLVALAAALLGLLLTNMDKLAFISFAEAAWIVCGLSVTVIGGVAHRVFHLYAVASESNAYAGLRAYLGDSLPSTPNHWSATPIGPKRGSSVI